jgi:hypothetical protein
MVHLIPLSPTSIPPPPTPLLMHNLTKNPTQMKKEEGEYEKVSPPPPLEFTFSGRKIFGKFIKVLEKTAPS